MSYPLRITNHTATASLVIDWDDGRRQQLSYLALRQACRCADCLALAQRTGQGPAPAADIRLNTIAPVGQYGIQLVFSDGHDRGIYPWPFLFGLE
ncbi:MULTISPECIES: DUF971 domain-containing protein [unclassified Herbaspirillum]|uniref:DUF971 domain-containing protein n=1 Tax=unclassified Herbaspirillum TaxID=2624150 RepID=UPI0011503C4E|nr:MULTISPECIES: DUF971 domain-containing protein [unclassified Herbaspirillum]MBB5393256.1 DUF971 family protein [Herbaspirillum sp. SJZ102]TQK03993.1 DUF971 family protein [Herbaspirillum sp. SJZ130]TQK08724.1 DUF971 family protein [Herbaspirillum sp. SJZ106]